MKFFLQTLDGEVEIADLSESKNLAVKIKFDGDAGEHGYEHSVTIYPPMNGDDLYEISLQAAQGQMIVMPVSGNKVAVRVDSWLDQDARNYAHLWSREEQS